MAAVNAVVYGKPDTQQAEVDAMAAAILAAIAALTCATHTYGPPVWNWSSNHSSATVKLTCTAGDKTVTLNATVTSTMNGDVVTYTATVTYEGNTYTDVYVEDLGHNLVHHNAKAPTCTEVGWEAYDTCSRCGYTTYVEIPALEHDWEFQGFTWTGSDAAGYTGAVAHYTCTRDAGHTTTKAATFNISDTNATCTQAGTTHYTASITAANSPDGKAHSAEKEVTGAPLGHNYVAVVTAATCTEGGYTTHTCSRCGDSYVDTYVNATGHHYGDPVWTWAADHSTATATFTCMGGDKTQTLDATVERTTEGDTITYTATVTFEGIEYTGTQTETMGVRVKSATVSLKDQIVIKFKLELKSGQASKYKVVYSLKGNETTKALSSFEKDSDGYYIVSVPVVAKEMTEPVAIWVLDNNNHIVSNQVTYSVETYCLNKIKNTSNAKDLRDLCAAILNYGAYAQITLNHNTGAMANRSLPEYGYSTAVPNVTVPETASSSSGSTAGITAKSATLGLEDVTIIKFKFELDSGMSISDYKFTCDGKTLTPKTIVESGKTRYQISITGTAAKNLDNMYTVKVTKNGKGTYSVTYGAFVYLYKKQNITDQGLGNLCKAMYDYHLKAKAYFK